MNGQTLLRNFDVLVEAPGGIDRLRDLIYQLALRGRLVAQDPEDEPVTELLARLDRERTSIESAGIFRLAKKGPNVTILPFQPPEGWKWLRLGDIAHPQPGFAFKSRGFNTVGAGMPLVRIRDIGVGRTECFFDGEYRSEFVIANGDYLVGMDGNFNIRRWSGDAALLNQRVTRLVFFGSELMKPFVAWALQSAINELQGTKAYTTVQHLAGKQIASAPICLPPIAEQRRIVAKVDELMGLCDELERRHRRRSQTGRESLASVLAALDSSESVEEVKSAWNRLDSCMSELVSRPGDVSQLRECVWRLATRGLLVRQDSGEAPAGDFLDKVHAMRDGRKTYGAVVVKEVSRRFAELPALPQGWLWAQFGDVAVNRDSERVPLRREDRELRRGPYDYYGASGVIDKIDDYLFEGPHLLIGEDGANLVSRSTPIAFLADGRFWVNNHAHVLASVDRDALDYLAIFVNSIDLKPLLTGTAQPKLNQARLNKIPVPVPPHSEQKRIVHRVRELLDLCDRLEEVLSGREGTARKFAVSATSSLILAT